jgi:hypothetical protein
MYQDLSVTVSGPVLRDLEKGYAVLLKARAEGFAYEASLLEIEDLVECIRVYGCLFIWHEDSLVETGELGIFCSRSIPWFTKIKDYVLNTKGDYEYYTLEIASTFQAIMSEQLVGPDDFGELLDFLEVTSELIWSHFIMHHLTVNES